MSEVTAVDLEVAAIEARTEEPVQRTRVTEEETATELA